MKNNRHKNSRVGRSKGGYILIDAGIALFICMVLVVASLAITKSIIISADRARNKIQDSNVISNHLETLRVLDWTEENIMASNVTGYIIEDTVYETKKMSITYSFDNEREYHYEIERNIHNM